MTRAMLVPVGGEPYEIDIDGYEGLCEAVEGRIDAAGWIFDDKPTIYLNDEGKFCCEPNRAVYAGPEDAGKTLWSGKVLEEGDLIEIIFGNFVAIGFDPNTGEDVDITDEEVARVLERFGGAESIGSGVLEVMRIQMGITSM